MSLQKKLDAYKAGFLKAAPPEAVAVMERATEELRASGIVDRVLKVGEKIPGFVLPNLQGEMVRSEDLLAGGPLVLSFYRGVW